MKILKEILLILLVLVIPCTLTGYSYVSNNYVMYNVKSHIYHKPTCEWAVKCTVNCKMIRKEEAVRLGRPCKVCGG